MNNSLADILKGRKVLFITTKNIDYIRNVQEIGIIKENVELSYEIYSNQKSYWKRIIDVWMQLVQFNIDNIDVIYIGFAPQLVLPLFYKKFRRKFIIIDFFISVYDTLVNDRKKFKAGGFIAKFCHFIDVKTLKKADHVITDTKADTKYFAEEFESDENKFETLYMKADSSIYYPRVQNKRADLQNKFVVLYFGSILPLQGVDVVLDTVKLLKEKNEIFFQIIGPISNKYSKPVQDNVEYIDWLSQEELAGYIANADLCLAGHFNGEIDKARRTIPGKAFIYSEMERPMILGDNEANKELFKEDAKVMYVKMGNSIDLKNAIIYIQVKYQKGEE